MKQNWIALLIGLAVLALAWPAGGRVSWRWRPATGAALFRTTPGWRLVYQANIRINGGQGQLEILGCEDPLPTVMARLRAAFAAAQPDAIFRQSAAGGWSLVHTGDAIIRTLVLNPGTPVTTIILVLTQSPADYEQSLKPSPNHLLEAAPAYPGSTPQSFMEDNEAAMQLEISSAPGRPEPVWSFFEAAFEQEGYRRMTPDGGHGPAESGLAVFQKGPSLCCVLVQPAPQANESTITVLHKQLRIE